MTVPAPGAPPAPGVPIPGAPAPWPPAGWPGPAWQGAHDAALALGILAAVSGPLGLVLGPIALSQANRARAFGPDCTAGRVTAWVGIALGALYALVLLAYLAMVLSLAATLPALLEPFDSGTAAAAAPGGVVISP